jgi:hypothetical protein
LTTATDVARLFFPRYLAASAPAALLLAAACSDLAPWRWVKFIVVAGIVGAAIWTSGIIQQFSVGGPVISSREEDWRGAVAWLNEQLPEHPYPILVASGLIEADGLQQPHDPLLEEYCLLPVNSLYRLRAERADLIPLTYHDPGKLLPAAREKLLACGGAWLVVRGAAERAKQVAGQAVAELDDREGSGFRVRGSGTSDRESHWNIVQRQSFGRVQVMRLSWIDASIANQPEP